METLSLAVVLNHEFAVPSAQRAEPATRLFRALHCPLRCAFITYAVEIEGEAPLYFFTEASDD